MKRSPLNRTFLSAHWRWLVMLNWRIDPEVLKGDVPAGTELDFFGGQTYVSLVGFLFQKTRLLGVPVPFHRNFEELNLRFYVHRDEDDERRRGVAFISELVPKRAIATIARRFYNENYVALPMHHDVSVNSDLEAIDVKYGWQKHGKCNHVRASGLGKPQALIPGSLEKFIAEHYWGYSAQRDGTTLEYRVRHDPWCIWQAQDVEIDCDMGTQYGSRFASFLSRPPESAFIADGSPITVSFPRRLPGN